MIHIFKMCVHETAAMAAMLEENVVGLKYGCEWSVNVDLVTVASGG